MVRSIFVRSAFTILLSLFCLCSFANERPYGEKTAHHAKKGEGILKKLFKRKSKTVEVEILCVDTLTQDTTITLVSIDRKEINRKKRNAVLLALALGPFGVHRLYLGTDAKVPVVYTLTLGGGFGILPLIDIVAILASDDLKEFTHNNKIMMWVK